MQGLQDQFRDVFGKYLEMSRDLPEDIVRKKGGDLAFKLYDGCKKRASTKGQISKEVRQQGWALKVPKDWREYHAPEFRKQKGEKTSKPALARFQKAVIELRQKGIRFISVGWLAAASKLGVATGKGADRTEHILGSIELNVRGHDALIVMSNYTPGVETLMNRYGIAPQAVREVMEDMQLYIDAKMQGLSGKTVGGKHG